MKIEGLGTVGFPIGSGNTRSPGLVFNASKLVLVGRKANSRLFP